VAAVPLAHYNEHLSVTRQIDSVEVVLVSPRNPLNTGAAARAMANFGFTRMSVVSPYAPHWREARSAVGAPQVLAEARECATLAEAVAGCTLVLGTGTLASRKPEQPVVSLPLVGSRLQQELKSGGRVALLFGPEKHGLTRDDLSLCHLLVEIPTNEQQPSMNLGQAVAVCLYELATRAIPSDEHAATDTAAQSGIAPQRGLPSSELDRIASLVEETMQAAGYSPRSMQAANHHDLRVLLRRLQFGPADARRILGLFRRILWRLKRPGANSFR